MANLFLKIMAALVLSGFVSVAQQDAASIASRLSSVKIGMTEVELERICGKPSFELANCDGSKLAQFVGNPETKGPIVGFGVVIAGGKVTQISPMFRDHPIMSADGRIIGSIPAGDSWKVDPVQFAEAVEIAGDCTKISNDSLTVIANAVKAALQGTRYEEAQTMTVRGGCSLVKALRGKYPDRFKSAEIGTVKLSEIIDVLRSLSSR